MNIVAIVLFSFLGLMLVFAWLAIVWLYVEMAKDMWEHRGWRKVRSKMGGRR